MRVPQTRIPETTNQAALFKDIVDHVTAIPLFDTHEHLMYEPERREKILDFYVFLEHYASTDLVSSGLPPADLSTLRDPAAALDTKWELFSKHWQYIKNTGYAKALAIAAQDIYGVDRIDFSASLEITRQMRDSQKRDFYQEVLRSKSNIQFVVNDVDSERKTHRIMRTEPDAPYFLPALRIDHLLGIDSTDELAEVEERYDVSLTTMAGFMSLLDRIFRTRADSAWAFKLAPPYLGRSLEIKQTSKQEAERAYSKLLHGLTHGGRVVQEIRPFQDYVYDTCLATAAELDLPVQIHTGLIEGIGTDIRISNPMDLIPVFLRHGKVSFDLFHAGYPYTDQLIAIVKSFPNCYFNLCWIPEISTHLYEQTLNRLIDVIPSNKVIAFGGDYMFVEGAYAAQKLARKAISIVLYDRIGSGYFDMDEAMGYATRILNTNARNLYMKKPKEE